MKAGKYNKNIEILRKEVVTSDYGTDKLTWNSIYRTKANAEYVKGDREEQNKEIFYSEFIDFTVHFYIKVENEDRVKFNDKHYRILSIQQREDTAHNDILIKTELVND